jgi:hypothetical protein
MGPAITVLVAAIVAWSKIMVGKPGAAVAANAAAGPPASLSISCKDAAQILLSKTGARRIDRSLLFPGEQLDESRHRLSPLTSAFRRSGNVNTTLDHRMKSPRGRRIKMTDPKMTDPMWVDTNTIIKVLRGDKIQEAELIRIRDVEGHQLLLPPKVNDELLNGNVLTTKPGQPIRMPSPAERARVEALKVRMKITLDMEGERVGGGQKTKMGPGRQIDVGQAERMDSHMNALYNFTESDALVLSQVKASAKVRGVEKPIIFTSDTAFVTKAQSRGVTARTPQQATSIPPAELPSSRGVRAQPNFNWKFTIAGGVAGLVAQAGALLLMSVGANARSQQRLTEYLPRLWPEIDRYVVARTRMVLDELASGGQAYVVAEIEFEYTAYPLQTPVPGQMMPGAPELTGVRLDSIGIFPKKREGESKPFRQHTQFGGVQTMWRYNYLSSELPLPPKEKVAQYRGVVETIKWLRTTLKAPTLSGAQRIELRQDIIALEKWMDESFGVIENFTPDPTLWTDDGRDRMQ